MRGFNVSFPYFYRLSLSVSPLLMMEGGTVIEKKKMERREGRKCSEKCEMLVRSEERREIV